MFNSCRVPQTIDINAISGTIVKNYKDSFILRFHMKSTMADQLFDKEPTLKQYGKYKPVVVLQVMLCGDQELLAEVMWKEDFENVIYPTKAESEMEE